MVASPLRAGLLGSVSLSRPGSSLNEEDAAVCAADEHLAMQKVDKDVDW